MENDILPIQIRGKEAQFKATCLSVCLSELSCLNRLTYDLLILIKILILIPISVLK